MEFFEFFGRLFFSRAQVKNIGRRLLAAGILFKPEKFLGFLSLVIIVIGLTVALSVYATPDLFSEMISFVSDYLPFSSWSFPVLFLLFVFILTYLITWIILSAILIIRIEGRRNALESALPDFLMLTSANMKAGMPLDQAMWYSAKPEFGLLSTEVRGTIKRAFSGESMEDALDSLVARFDSRVFTRTISLIKQAVASGGEVAAVLERTAADVRNTAIIKKEVAASLVLYEIFVLFAAVVGTPFLFAVAGKLIEVFEKFGGAHKSAALAEPIITSTDFFYFTIAAIFITALSSSFIVSIIKTGTKNEGMKYFPFVLGAAYFIYVVVTWIVSSIFVALT